MTVDGRRYWYFDRPDGEAGQKRRYVGLSEDPLISERVETFKGEKSNYKAPRKFVSTLTREAGLIAADRFTGDLIQALARAGLFRLRGVLIGKVAFQCYSAYLGIRLPSAAILTGDADLARISRSPPKWKIHCRRSLIS